MKIIVGFGIQLFIFIALDSRTKSYNAAPHSRIDINQQVTIIEVLLAVSIIAVLSVISLLSYNVLGDVGLGGRNFNDILDYFSNQILLPLGGLFIAIFAGWVMNKEHTRDELSTLSAGAHRLWHFLIRFVVPPAVAIIFVMGVLG